MGGFRAKDADRERYVEVIESAYVDGQLGEQDRELRVSRALTAETLDELDALTRDLQNQPAAVVVHPTPAPEVVTPAPLVPPRPTTALPTTPSGSGAAKVIWFAVVAVFAVVVLGMVSSAQDDLDPFGPGTEYSTIPWDEIDDAGGLAPEQGFRVRAADVRAMVSGYQEQFGSPEAYQVVFYPRRVVVEVPVGGRGQRFERWVWDGTWTRTAAPSPVDGRRLIDLREIAAGPLVDNIGMARDALRVEQGRFDRAVLGRSGDEPAVVTITVTNQFNESGSLTTTPAGEILGRQPYER